MTWIKKHWLGLLLAIAAFLRSVGAEPSRADCKPISNGCRPKSAHRLHRDREHDHVLLRQ
jgi:hypothetical protein